MFLASLAIIADMTILRSLVKPANTVLTPINL